MTDKAREIAHDIFRGLTGGCDWFVPHGQEHCSGCDEATKTIDNAIAATRDDALRDAAQEASGFSIKAAEAIEKLRPNPPAPEPSVYAREREDEAE